MTTAMASTMGSIMAVVAVLEIHIDKKPEMGLNWSNKFRSGMGLGPSP